MGLFRIIIGAFIFSVFTNLYSYKRFIKKVSFFTPHLKKIRIFFYIISALEFVFVLQLRFSFLNIELYLIAGTLIGFSLFLFGVSLFYDVVRSICSKAYFNPTRRKFIKFCFDVTFVIFILTCLIFGGVSALKIPFKKQATIKMTNVTSKQNLINFRLVGLK